MNQREWRRVRGRAGRDGVAEDAPGQDTDDLSGRPASVAKILLWCCHCCPDTCRTCLPPAAVLPQDTCVFLHLVPLVRASLRAPWPGLWPPARHTIGPRLVSAGSRRGRGGPGHGGPRLPGVATLGGAPAAKGGPRTQLESLLAPTRTAITRVYLSK